VTCSKVFWPSWGGKNRLCVAARVASASRADRRWEVGFKVGQVRVKSSEGGCEHSLSCPCQSMPLQCALGVEVLEEGVVGNNSYMGM